MSPRFWPRWLVAVTLIVGLLGLAMVVLPEPLQRFWNLVLFGSPRGEPVFDAAAVAYIRFSHGVLGAMLVGWAGSMLVVLVRLWPRAPRDAWFALAGPLVLWFVPDTLMSLLTGFWPNAVLNALLATGYVVPLAATWRGTTPPP